MTDQAHEQRTGAVGSGLGAAASGHPRPRAAGWGRRTSFMAERTSPEFWFAIRLMTRTICAHAPPPSARRGTGGAARRWSCA
jgi:hypothetical protein